MKSTKKQSTSYLLYWTIVVLLAGLILLLVWFSSNIEGMTDDTKRDLLQYVVVHMKEHEDRYQNIIENEKLLGQPILIFDAVRGKDLDVSNLDHELKQFDFRLKNEHIFRPKNIGQIGCFLSHLLLFRSCIDSPYSYTVVFEDDFDLIDGTETHARLVRILNQLQTINPDFGILMLGTIGDPAFSDPLNTEQDLFVFNPDPQLVVYGTHGYVVNNRKASLIYNNLLTIKQTIDCQMFDLIRENIISGYVVKPMMVQQNWYKYGTTISME